MQAWITSPPPSLPGKGVAPRLYDSATASTLTLPREGGSRARLYVCGITPYDATHLGHARTYLTFDLLNRVWADAGYDVAYTQNVTDVDDPLLERARRDGVAWQQLAQQETDRFRSDMAALSVLPPTTFLGVTEAVDLIAGSVAELLRLSAAYELDGDIYFSLDADPHFGSVAHLSRSSMLELFAERGGDPEREGKKNPLDPLLWRAARPDEPSWDSSVGRGRPGWHIECTAIALSSLGMGIAVQGGGCDLTFPHHEMSASHASVLTEAHPFAQAYVHVGMVEYQGEKMSKSLGNLVFVSELLAAGTDPRAIRLSLIGRHHQHDFEWSAADLTAAEERLESWRTAVGRSAAPDARPLLDALRTSLANDLDAAAAMGEVDRWAQTPGNDPSAPGLAADAVSALLGIDLAA